MTAREIRVGDRVHVEFDGVATYVEEVGPLVRVGSDDNDYGTWIAADACTVIVPPVQVGDVVTADNIGQLPIGSVIAATSAYQLVPVRGRTWNCVNGESYSDTEMLSGNPTVVLRIGGSS